VWTVVIVLEISVCVRVLTGGIICDIVLFGRWLNCENIYLI